MVDNVQRNRRKHITEIAKFITYHGFRQCGIEQFHANNNKHINAISEPQMMKLMSTATDIAALTFEIFKTRKLFILGIDRAPMDYNKPNWASITKSIKSGLFQRDYPSELILHPSYYKQTFRREQIDKLAPFIAYNAFRRGGDLEEYHGDMGDQPNTISDPQMMKLMIASVDNVAFILELYFTDKIFMYGKNSVPENHTNPNWRMINKLIERGVFQDGCAKTLMS